MAERADVVICGAGVIGASIAYHLGLHGIASLVVERERIAHGASGTAAGLLSPVAESEAATPMGQLLARSMKLHRQIAADLDGAQGYDFADVDSKLVATNAEERAALAAHYGEERVEAVSTPGWIDRDVAGAVTVEGAAQLDPAKFTERLLEEACLQGTRVLKGDVQGLRTENGRVSAVLVSAETIETERVVVAMGPWSPEADGWLRMPIPVTPLKGQILKYRMEGGPAGQFSTLDGNYAVRKPNGVVYAGTTEEEAGFDLSVTQEARDSIATWAASVSSRFDGPEPFEQTACLRPLSADGLPLIGPAPAFQGAFIATGHGRKGIMLSTGTGEVMAELIATGTCTSMDLSPFDPGRFRATPKES